jgi:mono/diheme cytochrome c family protein
MIQHSRSRYVSISILLSVLVTTSLLAEQSSDQESASDRSSVKGSEIFRHYWASCHGIDGRGHGPASAALKHGAPDLTQVARRNGGKFPVQHVRDIIEGKESSPMAHGSQEMPVWGPIFHRVEWDQDLVQCEAGRDHQVSGIDSEKRKTVSPVTFRIRRALVV